MPETAILEQKFQDRKEQVDGELRRLGQQLAIVGVDVKTIRDNHLSHLGTDVTILKTKMDSITWWFRTMAAAVIGNLGGIIYLIMDK